MWLLVQRRILCRTVLLTKRVVQDSTCEICHEAEESPEHIVYGCKLGHDLWQQLNIPSMLSVDLNSLHTISPQGGVPQEEFSAFIALVCWQLWKARNAAVFRNESLSINQVLASCKATAE